MKNAISTQGIAFVVETSHTIAHWLNALMPNQIFHDKYNRTTQWASNIVQFESFWRRLLSHLKKMNLSQKNEVV